MYRCDVASGALTLDTENPGDVLGWGTEDESFEARVRMAHALHTHTHTLEAHGSCTDVHTLRNLLALY